MSGKLVLYVSNGARSSSITESGTLNAVCRTTSAMAEPNKLAGREIVPGLELLNAA